MDTWETSSSELIETSSSWSDRLLTREEFYGLAEVPPEGEWFADIQNENTRAAYAKDVSEFRRFIGIERLEELRVVTRAHVLAWRKDLERKELAASTIRRKLSALSSLFWALTDANAIQFNPVSGVSRPKKKSIPTPLLSDEQMKGYLDAPDPSEHKAFSRKLKAVRDRAILSTLAYHGLRVTEMIDLTVRSVREHRWVKIFCVYGKGDKYREIPVHSHTMIRIEEYLEMCGHKEEREAPLFQSVRTPGEKLTRAAVFHSVIRKYARQARVDPFEVSAHSFRATAATNAEENRSDLKEIQGWMGHASVSTTETYARRRVDVEESPTFKVGY